MLYFFNLVNVKFPEGDRRLDQGQDRPDPDARRRSSGSGGAPCSRGSRDSSTTSSSSTPRRDRPATCRSSTSWSAGRSPSSSSRRSAARPVAGGPLEGRARPRDRHRDHRPLHRLRDGADGAQRGREQPDDLDHGGRRPRHDHVPERLDDHLAAPETDHRRRQGDGRNGRRGAAGQAAWARRAFLASRTNAWLSVPMLFFMGAASHFPIFSTIDKVGAP